MAMPALPAMVGMREREASTPPLSPISVSIVRLVVLFAVAFGGMAIGSLVFFATHPRPPVPRVTTIAAPLSPPPPPRASLGWVDALPDAPACTATARRVGPAESKIDGATSWVGLLWLRGAVVDGLHVVAFDPLTLRPRWIAGPYPGVAGVQRNTLTVVNDLVVLGDTDGLLRVLDGRTGEELRSAQRPRGSFHACADNGAVRLDDALFDPVLGRLTPAKAAPHAALAPARPGDRVTLGDAIFLRTESTELVLDASGAVRGRLEAL